VAIRDNTSCCLVFLLLFVDHAHLDALGVVAKAMAKQGETAVVCSIFGCAKAQGDGLGGADLEVRQLDGRYLDAIRVCAGVIDRDQLEGTALIVLVRPPGRVEHAVGVPPFLWQGEGGDFLVVEPQVHLSDLAAAGIGGVGR
jgi:hypothetical protein